MLKTNFALFFLFVSTIAFSQPQVLVSSGTGYGNQQLIFDQVITAAEACVAEVTTTPNMPTATEIDGKNVVIVAAPDLDFAPAEVLAIENLLTTGGVLFVVGEWGPAFQQYNDRIDGLLAQLGSSMTNVNNIFNTQCNGGDGPLNLVDTTSCVMQGVTEWQTQAMAHINEGNGNILFEGGGEPGFVEEELFNGLIYYISDINWLMPPACPENSIQAIQMLSNMICGCAIVDTTCNFLVSVDYENGEPALEGCEEVCINFTLYNGDTSGTSITLGIDPNSTATEGEDFPILIDEIFIEPGETSAQICFTPEVDGITEGLEEAIFVTFDPCTDSMINFSVLIDDVDSVQAAVTGTEAACEGQFIELIADVSGGVGPYEYVWNTGDVDSSISLILGENLDFFVVVSDQCGFIDTLFYSIVSDCCEEPILHYSLNDCDASEGETDIYNEFTAEGVCDLECSDIAATFIF